MERDGEVKPGDIVKLKSGGPDMTVSSVVDEEFCKCDWFIGGKIRKTGTFTTASLQKKKLVS